MSESKYEKANRFVVNALVRCPQKYNVDDGSLAVLDRINKKIKGNNNFATSWTNKKGALNKGRRFAKTSLAGLARPIRNVLAQQYYWDCDMENASFTAIANVIAANKWVKHFPAIMSYHANRESTLDAMRQKTKTTRDNAKKAYISALFGGDIGNWNYLPLKDISTEAKDLFLRLTTMGNKDMNKLHSNIVADDEIKKKSKHNICGQFLCNITTMFEREALENVLQVITNLGYSYGATMNDGVFIEKHPTKSPQEIIAEVNKKSMTLRTMEATQSKLPNIQRLRTSLRTITLSVLTKVITTRLQTISNLSHSLRTV